MSALFPTPRPIDTRLAADASVAARIWAVIPCAGVGVRAGNDGVPKQYKPLAGRPLVGHTLAAFAALGRLAGGVVVVAAGDRFFDGQAAMGSGWTVAACGGATRAETVANGLHALRAAGAAGHDWVLVHDAARCLVTADQIDRLIDACGGDAVGGLLALPVADTLKASNAQRVAETIDRAGKWLAQTPQMFRIDMLAQALATAGSAATDESSAIEAAGHEPLLVSGSALNFKVTWPEDFVLAEAVLQQRSRTAGTADTATPAG